MRTFMHFCERENGTAILKKNLADEFEYVCIKRPSIAQSGVMLGKCLAQVHKVTRMRMLIIFGVAKR